MADVCTIDGCSRTVSIVIEVNREQFRVCEGCASRIKKSVAERMVGKI